MTPKYVAISMRPYICNALLIPPPSETKSYRYATEVDSEIYDMGPLSHDMADDFFIHNPPLPSMFQHFTYFGQKLTDVPIWSTILIPLSLQNGGFCNTYE